MTENSLEAVANVLSQSSNILLTTHRSPDGDGLGSCLGLAAGLRKVGKSVTVFNSDPCPLNLAFLPGSGELQSVLTNLVYDAIVMCDCGEPERVADDLSRLKGVWIVLDHHQTERTFGDIRVNDSQAPSTSELVLRLLNEMSIALDSDIATCLYTGLVVDTGNFRFSNATLRAFQAAARLVGTGINASHIASLLFEGIPESKLRLTAAALATLERTADGRIAWLTVTPELLTATGATPADLDGLVNYPRSLAGCDVAVQFFDEPEKGYVRASLRTSRDPVDVESVARVFGGGGHKHAAGCSVPGKLPEAKKRLIDELEKMLQRTPA